MSRFARANVYETLVAAAAAILCLVILAVVGDGWVALAGFSLLGLLGLTPVLFGSRGGIEDERDESLGRRANTTASAVFWLAFVLWAVVLSTSHGRDACVPTLAVAYAVPVGWTLQTLVRGLTVLGLERRER